MSDLISRQAAIDRIRMQMDRPDTFGLWAHYDKIAKVCYGFVIETLERLPSEGQEIVRCKDCKYQYKGSNELEFWNLCGYRSWLCVPTDDEHYCGYAERRTDE